MRLLRISAALAVAAALACAADPLYDSARKKLDAIEAEKEPRGATVNFSYGEIMAWAKVRIPEIIPEGMKDIRLELGTNAATGYATVDLLKMRQAQGIQTNWLISKLIEGERQLKVSIRMQSAGGRCTVYLTSVQIGAAQATGSVLDVLVKSFFLPLYPDAHINEPFELDYNMERIEVRPAGARVVIKR